MNRFDYKLARLKGSIFIPNTETPFIDCWKKALEKLNIPISDFPVLNNPPHVRDVPGVGQADDILLLCATYQVNCLVYILKETPEYSYFELEANYPRDKVYKKNVILHTQGTRWCLFYKSGSGRIKALDRVKCNTCCEWVYCLKKKTFLREHYKNCIRCKCGTGYQKGSDHPNKCSKRKLRKGVPVEKKVRTSCKKYEPDTAPHYHQHNHHADYETIPVGYNNNMEVDSAGLWDDTNNKYFSWCGKDALKHWFDYVVENLSGTLWFFYGSKFDCHMIYTYMIRNGIPMDKVKKVLSAPSDRSRSCFHDNN